MPLNYTMRIHPLSFFFVAIALLLGCARPVAPIGGDKDIAAPVLDTTHSAPNRSVNFQKRPLEFKFNEWLTLKDPSTQVLVSPPLIKPPIVTLRGKTVKFEFAKTEELRPNTTYTINFGEAITDFTEGNALKNFTYVFSTGSFIDSLSFQGTLLDALTGKGVENIGIALYEDMADSTPVKERPFYYAVTDAKGAFALNNLKGGAFKLVAFDDQNKDKRWNQDNEKVGFSDTTIVLSGTKTTHTGLQLFTQKPFPRILSKETSGYGLAKIGFSAGADTVAIKIMDTPPGMAQLEERIKDTVYIWYDYPDSLAAWRIMALKDTIKVTPGVRANFLKNTSLRLAGTAGPPKESNKKKKKEFKSNQAAVPAKSNAQHPAQSAEIAFSYPIVKIDTARWRLTSDSGRIEVRNFNAQPDSISKRKIKFSPHWESSKKYSLQILPGGVTDFFGRTNADTIRLEYLVLDEKQFSSISLSLKNLTPGMQYLAELLNGDKIEQSRLFRAAQANTKITFSKLPQGTYQARLTEDQNDNGQWDTGDYWQKKQPEKSYSKTFDPLRPNWETDAEWDLKPLVLDKKSKKIKK